MNEHRNLVEAEPGAEVARGLRAVAAGAFQEEEVEVLYRRGLEWLARVAPYDLATIFLLDGDELVAVHAAGPLADERVRRHRLPLARFPSLRTMLESRRARLNLEHDHRHGDGDPFDGVLDLPHGHACLVAPLYAGETALGVLALDRKECRPYGDDVLEAVEVFASLLGLALVNAEQRRLLLRLHRQESERIRLLEREVAGDALLEESRSPAMQAVVALARRTARSDAPVLLLGETGTGKEVLARAIHGWSARAAGPFVRFNCAAVPESLVESELFGHEKGAFTGATRRRAGRFQTADGGTLLLDEVGELALPVQAKLLRVLQEGVVEPVGADRPVDVSVRILAATNRDLAAEVEAGRFRRDLFFRLDVVSLTLPSLRERTEDLEPLVDLLLARLRERSGRGPSVLSPRSLEWMREYDWPGNVRELQNALERAAIQADGPEIRPERPGSARRTARAAPEPVDPTEVRPLVEVERDHVLRALAATRGKLYGKDGAAALLGLKPTTLQSRMKRWGIRRTPDGA